MGKLARIYYPLGLVAPVTLEGKQIYREVCESKSGWDAPLDNSLKQRWKKWEQKMSGEYQVPRAIANYEGEIDGVGLRAFSNASTKGVGAAVYSVIRQSSGITQQLLAAMGGLAKKSLTILRLELVGAHMATNLLVNVRNALDSIPTPQLFAWVDSTVVLHWIRGNGQYKQFVANQVAKIQLQKEIQWRYEATNENPAILASRGGPIKSKTLWEKGPGWLQEKSKWPENPVTQSSPASEEEAKVIKEILNVAKTQDGDEFDHLLERVNLRKALRVGVWIRRFAHNCKGNERKVGPVTTEEVTAERNGWIRCVQEREQAEPHFKELQAELGLQRNKDGLLVCHDRIRGQYPVYLPQEAKFTEKLLQRVHSETFHGGVSLTMVAVREQFWFPRLRSLVKLIRSNCYGSMRYRAIAMTRPAPGHLPEERTTVGGAFEVVGTDFAGPMRYKRKGKKDGKAYLTIFACSLSRAVHLELLPNLETETFIPCLKRLIARRGRPCIIYSDNGGTLVKTAKWLSQLRKDERLQSLLEQHEIVWKFNLSRARCSWTKLSEVLLDVETQINRRPLDYVEDDPQLPTLTPATFLYQRTCQLPEMETWRIADQDLRKRAKFLKSCKDSLWRRWQREYLRALRERHNLTHKVSKFQPKEGDIVIVKVESKNRGTWPLAKVKTISPYVGKDGIIRGVQLETASRTLDRPVQLLYPLELKCDTKPTKEVDLNPDAQEFQPKRAAAEAAKVQLGQIAQAEMEESEI